ncbi:MAG: hypothetical protein IH851_02960 [Armatimonadetes bacterium]|nr:hypothetical protein [Armatimonadota bacterium]
MFMKKAVKSIHCGYYSSESDAAKARDTYIRDNHPDSEYYRYNFPKGDERSTDNELTLRSDWWYN